MKVTNCEIPGLLVIEPRVFEDDRGVFYETFNLKKFKEASGLASVDFYQDNESISKKNVLRGLHFQVPPYAQGKLVRVTSGKVLDVAVDIRKGSPTYGQYHIVELSAENKKIFWIPPGFAHGFVALEDETIFNYKCTDYYHPESERTIQWNDLDLAIKWGVKTPIISEKDQKGQVFTTFVSDFQY
jgi:dTDP-4-dehydrorhamnose 3,5-epimerase